MFINPCLRIIEENCANYKEKRKLHEMLESYGGQMTERMITNLYDSTLKRSDIDFDIVEKSKGDVTNLAGYENMISSLSLLQSLSIKSKIQIPEIKVIEMAISNLKKFKYDFTRAFKLNNQMMILYYNTLVHSCLECTSLLISSYVDFVKSKNTVTFTVKKGKGIAGNLCLKNLNAFNNSCNNGEFMKFAKQMTTPDNNELNLVSEIAFGTVATGIAIAASIIPVLRSVVYYFYYSRMKVTTFLEQQSTFLEMNKANIESMTVDAMSKKEVMKKQNELIKKFQSIADKIRVNEKITTNKANNEINSENKKWTLDNVKPDDFALL